MSACQGPGAPTRQFVHCFIHSTNISSRPICGRHSSICWNNQQKRQGSSAHWLMELYVVVVRKRQINQTGVRAMQKIKIKWYYREETYNWVVKEGISEEWHFSGAQNGKSGASCVKMGAEPFRQRHGEFKGSKARTNWHVERSKRRSLWLEDSQWQGHWEESDGREEGRGQATHSASDANGKGLGKCTIKFVFKIILATLRKVNCRR